MTEKIALGKVFQLEKKKNICQRIVKFTVGQYSKAKL